METTEDADLRLARKLQEEEDANLEQRRREQLQRDDQVMAMLLQQEMNQEQRAAFYRNSNYRVVQQQPSQRFTHMRSGQIVDICLHHPHTANHIGETL
jgi:hypothetical protein